MLHEVGGALFGHGLTAAVTRKAVVLCINKKQTRIKTEVKECLA
jgi:hypothetical protein